MGLKTMGEVFNKGED